MLYFRRPPQRRPSYACGRKCGGAGFAVGRAARILRHLGLLAALAASGLAAAASPCLAEGWHAVISGHGSAPAYLVAVDKSKQQLAFFEHRSPLRLTRVFACTTGQATGDKKVQGDLKTPEGIYFVGYRIGSGLDFLKYGNEAYTLNYPNPVDRLRRKTGYGIWIHGRGEPLTPLQTEGCVSLNNADLDILGKVLRPGTPVALAGTLAFTPKPAPADAEEARALEDKVRKWADLWSSRSKGLFDLYDATAYSLSTESFSAFKAQKERLFSQLPWIRTTVRDVQSLKGPGYWVTWFYQDYQAPNLSTRGVRRLYWGRNEAGDFKILGMEWQPGLDTSLLLASAEGLLPESGAPQGPLWPGQVLPSTDADGTSLTASLPVQKDASASSERFAAAAPEAAPWTPPLPEKTANEAASAAVTAPAAPLSATASPSGDEGPESAPKEKARAAELPRPAPEAFALAERLNKKTRPAVSPQTKDAEQSPKAAPEQNAARATAYPDLNLPPALPSQGLAAVSAAPPAPPAIAEASPASMQDRSPKSRQIATAATEKNGVSPSTATAVTATAQETPPPDRERPGRAEAPAPAPALADAPDAEAAPALASASTEPALAAADDGAAPDAAALSLTLMAEEVQKLVEHWRLAWEKGDIDAYMAFYAPDAAQGGRSGLAAIRRHKEQIWPRLAPSLVRLEDVRVRLDNGVLSADMRQEYRNTGGGGDIGLKTLTFQKINNSWLIVREDWTELTDEAGH